MDLIFGTDVRDVLAGLDEGLDPLAVAAETRRRLGPELGRRAAELHALRLRARSRFDSDFLPYLNRKGLEQATPQAVAEARARRIRERLPDARVWDATCGIGAESVALQRAEIDLVSSDLAPENCRFTRENLYFQARTRGASWKGKVLRARAEEGAVRADVVLIDPDRRAEGRRSLDPGSWSPSFAASVAIALRHAAGCLKLAPAIELDSVEPLLETARARGVPLAWSWTSWRGSLVEACLSTGELATGELATGELAAEERETADRAEERRTAIVIDGTGREARLEGRPERRPALEPDELESLEWLAEPDPAVIRSGLVGRLARELGMAPIAPRSAYLGATGAMRNAAATAGLARAWRVLGSCPLDRKRVRALLGEHDVGTLTVKKRGHPESSDVLAKRFRGPGTRRGLLAVARLERGHRAFLLRDESARS